MNNAQAALLAERYRLPMNNAQAALIAAASHFSSGSGTSSQIQKEVLMWAREYQTWLDRQDELARRLHVHDQIMSPQARREVLDQIHADETSGFRRMPDTPLAQDDSLI